MNEPPIGWQFKNAEPPIRDAYLLFDQWAREQGLEALDPPGTKHRKWRLADRSCFWTYPDPQGRGLEFDFGPLSQHAREELASRLAAVGKRVNLESNPPWPRLKWPRVLDNWGLLHTSILPYYVERYRERFAVQRSLTPHDERRAVDLPVALRQDLLDITTLSHMNAGLPLHSAEGEEVRIKHVADERAFLSIGQTTVEVGLTSVEEVLLEFLDHGWVQIPDTAAGTLAAALLLSQPETAVVQDGAQLSVTVDDAPGEALRETTALDFESLDQPTVAYHLKEQALLRRRLLGGSARGACALCGRTFPERFLVAAHIKRRSECTSLERLDHSVVMLACKFGCDELYENGYLAVDGQGVVRTLSEGSRRSTAVVDGYLKLMEGRRCRAYAPANRQYFSWHAMNRFLGSPP